MFDPMTDVPKTDDEAIIALHRSDKLRERAMIGLYRARRAQGDDILKAYKTALLAHVEAANKSVAKN